MSIKKSDQANLRNKYQILSQLGLVLTLLLLISAFKFDIFKVEPTLVQSTDVTVVNLENIPISKQEEKALPPKRPRAPVETVDDDTLEEDVFDFTSEFPLDFSADIGPPPKDDPAVEEFSDEPFVTVEEMPELIGGLASLAGKLTYPELAKKAGVEGTVYVQFVVSRDGSVKNPFIVKGIGAGCDEEALRVVKELKFTPGRQRGVAVNVKSTVPIVFRLR